MTMRILDAQEFPANYAFRVHIDETKLATIDEVEQPDPAYVMDFSWGKDQTLTTIKREMKLICEQRLAELTPQTLNKQVGTAL